MVKALDKEGILYLFRIEDRLKMVTDETKTLLQNDYDFNNKRIIKYTVDNKPFYMFTNLVDRNKYPITTIINLYHDRWKIEEYYKFQKNYLHLFPFKTPIFKTL